MADEASQQTKPASHGAAGRQQLGRLRRLVLKELREILRDRRTIVTLVVMPLLIYPLLAIAFQRFLLTSLSVAEDVNYVVGVDSPIGRQMLQRQLLTGEAVIQDRARHGERVDDEAVKNENPFAKLHGGNGAELPKPTITLVDFPDSNLERFVADSSLHLAAVHRRERQDDSKKGLQSPVVWELIYRAGSPTSEAALHFVESRLQASNEFGLDQQLKKMDVSAALAGATQRKAISFSGAPTFSLAALIPLILVLMTVTGAVYPAIDLTAGERERGTLETLIAAPVPRLGLLLAKYVAVLTVALLTAVVNLIGMTITAHSSGLSASLFGGGMSFGVVVKVLLLLALFAAFFSAILLALTSYARSFKEAQAYIIPLMLLCLVPGVLCLIPGLEFQGWMAVTPLVNIVMLARDLLEGSVHPTLAMVAISSTVFYIAAAIALAARIFGTDAILYGSPATWSDLMRRPEEPQRAPTLGAAMFCLALMFPAFFVLANSIGRSSEFSMQGQLVIRALITAAVFGGIPIAMATIGRVEWGSGLGLRRPSALAVVGSVFLGVSLWPVAHEITLLVERLGLLTINPELMKKAEAIARQFQAMPLWLVLVTFAIVPAVFEELCFRGFIFGALRERLSGTWTVVVTALLFGFFHEVLFPGKLVTSAALGLVFGSVRLWTGSVIPGMVVHAVLNALLFTVIYYENALKARWDFEGQAHFPLTWHALATVGILVGVGLIVISARHCGKAATNEAPSV